MVRMRPTMAITTAAAAILLSAAAIGIGAAVDTPPTLMSRAQYHELLRTVDAESRMEYARCRDAVGTDRDVCKAMARAADRVRRADLDALYYGTVKAQARAKAVRARASYEVARARCISQLGEERLECLKEARDERTPALAESPSTAS